VFTGIVEELGRVAGIDRSGGRARLHVECREVVAGARVGDSVAVNGCCLTLAALVHDAAGPGGKGPGPPTGFVSDLMAETLRATDLGDLRPGDPVNLERPTPVGGRLGGHLVQGHVDAVGRVVGRDERPGTVSLSIAAPPAVARYLAPKGSVTVQGISLTVVDVEPAPDGVVFRVGLVPHTSAVTTMGSVDVGDRVNLEADVVAKYVERLLDGAFGGDQGASHAG
jgi:riboflavin synthase